MPPGTPHADDACGHRPGGGGVGRSNLLRQAPISRWLAARLRKNGRRVAIIPMPYSDLDRQRAQRFATLADLDSAACTVEERDEYEPHIAAGGTVFAGVDYGEIVPRAAAESDSRRIAHHAGCERRGRPARAHAEDRPTITHGTMPFGAGWWRPPR